MNKILLPLTAVALCFTAQQAMAAQTDPATGTAKAKIIAPVTVEAGDDLDFGTILSGANTVTVTTAGARSATDSTKLVGNTASAGSFDVTTSETVSASLNLPSSVTITRTGGTETMTVSNLSSDFGSGAQQITSSGKTFHVGGDLAVSANQKEGDYTGTYNVTIDY